jgi:hypothetical protein
MKFSSFRGSPNLHFTNSTDGGAWQKRGQPENPLYLCAPAVFQIFFKTLSVTDYSIECFRLHKCTNNLLCSFMHCVINPLSAELNPIRYLLALLAHHFLYVSRIRVRSLTLRLLMSYMYGAPILDVFRSHTTTQHSR